MMCKITVFTPTYNRAYILENLYRSLQAQTYQEFEWVIVDDGSTDQTENLVNGWISEENTFAIYYHKKENGGKQRAVNVALDLAKGELFLVVDSDDTLTSDALEKIISWEKELPKGKRFCGVAANRGFSKHETPNELFGTPYVDTTFLDKTLPDGERALAFYTDIHRQYRYPEFEGEKFITEAVVYNRMARDGYKMRFYNDIVWIYEYREDGLTKAGFRLFADNPRGYGLWLKEKQEFTDSSLKAKLRLYYSFMCDLKDRYDTKTIAECIGAPRWVIAGMKLVHSFLHPK